MCQLQTADPQLITPLAVYIHTPFCPSKCGYCDFNSYAMDGPIVERTVAGIVAEILRSPLRGAPAKTIFFGGGTPTFLSSSQLIRILDAVREVHPPIDGCEITSEANPGTVDAEKFEVMVAAGFNRLSLGAQSFLDDDLIRLDRIHKASEIERAVQAARSAGFDNLNLDMMFALPSQSRIGWDRNLDKALSLQPDHLSLYCLTIEPNTAFYKKNLRGELDLPDDEIQREMYEECLRRTQEVGLMQYEISNFAKPGRECRHNLCYWYGEDYAGYGPGAVGCITLDGVSRRYTNLKHPDRYCEAVENGQPIFFESEDLSPETRKIEKVMLGLRLNEGISITEVDDARLPKLLNLGWIVADHDRVQLSSEGRHFCSEVALELIDL
ncbi:MAG: radical SAM family heme chaperone HemW [Armatimonadetes bacterium]|nr:radical SAM family heme chaperone HemW [Armatimonadota bacterium]